MRQLVNPPSRTPLSFGLFSASSFVTAPDNRWQAEGIEWETVTCSPAQLLPAECSELSSQQGPFVALDGYPLSEANSFVVAVPMECTPVGMTEQVLRDRAETVLRLREESAVERAIWTGEGGALHLLANPVTLTGPLDPTIALGEVEAFLAATYGSTGVIHVSYETATTLGRYKLINPAGQKMFTRLGTPVVVGAGYSTPTTVDTAGSIVGSPAIWGYRSESVDVVSAFNGARNELMAVATRVYVAAFDQCQEQATIVAPITLGG